MLNKLISVVCLFISLIIGEIVMAQDFYIDVRSSEEYLTSPISNTVNIPHTLISSQITSLNITKDDTIYLFCRSGRRADIAKQSLQELGYQNVINLGGFDDAQKFINSKK